MIEEAYVSYETARLLQEKGFDETCYACYEYFSSGVTMYSGWPFEYKGEVVQNSKDRVKCPTQQMVMRWLREVHHLHIEVEVLKPYDMNGGKRLKSTDRIEFHATIVHTDQWNDALEEFKNEGIGWCETYEECVEEAIKYCLEHLIE